MPDSYEIQPASPDGPEIPVRIAGVEYPFNWRNTTIRKFLVGHDDFDYVAHIVDDSSLLPVFFDQEGGEDLLELLEKNMFPVRIDPVLDQDTIDLFVMRGRRSLEDALDGNLEF